MRSTKEIQDLIDMPSSTIFCLWSSKNLIDHFEHLQIFGADFLDLNLLNRSLLAKKFVALLWSVQLLNFAVHTFPSHFKRSEIGKMKAILAFLDAFCCAYLLGYLLEAVSTSKSTRHRNRKCSQLLQICKCFRALAHLKFRSFCLMSFLF